MRTSDFDLTRYDRQEHLVLWWEFWAQINEEHERKRRRQIEGAAESLRLRQIFAFKKSRERD